MSVVPCSNSAASSLGRFLHACQRTASSCKSSDMILLPDGKARQLFFLNHPERLVRWSSPKELQRDSTTIDDISTSFPDGQVKNFLLSFRGHTMRVECEGTPEPSELAEIIEEKLVEFWAWDSSILRASSAIKTRSTVRFGWHNYTQILG